MKYSVGDIFIDNYNSIVVITAMTMPFSSETWTAAYSVMIEGRRSFLRWYDHDLDAMKNITCPVLKELYS